MVRVTRSLSSSVALSFALAGSLTALSTAAVAGDKRKLRCHASLVTTKFDQAKVDDQPEHLVMYGEMDGVMFSDPGGGFLDHARYQVVYVSDTGGMVSGGYKTFTTAEGKVFAKFEDKEVNPPVYKGTFELIGGTGKYQGIKGNGTWVYTMISDSVAYDSMDGEYELP